MLAEQPVAMQLDNDGAPSDLEALFDLDSGESVAHGGGQFAATDRRTLGHEHCDLSKPHRCSGR